MEAPIAAALGRLDGLNLFDPFWMDPEYETWYRLLNCGIRLPASTGSDWFVCSSNRVYVDVGSDFSYAAWLACLRAGRTIVTNGPVLRLAVDGHAPSTDVLDLAATRRNMTVTVEYETLLPIDRVEIVRDGAVVASTLVADGAGAGPIRGVGRRGRRRLAGRPLLGPEPNQLRAPGVGAHEPGVPPRATGSRIVRAAAEALIEAIDRSQDWLRSRARYDDGSQKTRMLQLFTDGREVFERCLRDP